MSAPLQKIRAQITGQPSGRALSLLCAFVALTSCIERGDSFEHSSDRQPVVYGDDDRLDWYDHPSEQWREITKTSIVALVRPERLDRSDPDAVTLITETLGVDEELCAGERFFDQPVLASCSGTLIDVDLVLTAGHCVDSIRECEERLFVFDYYAESDGVLATLTDEAIYECRQLVVTADGDADYGVVQLDRPVDSLRVPVMLRDGDSALAIGAPLTVIGFPDGIPAKIDDGGVVLDDRASTLDYFQASLDTFGGNSGSGVFDATGELVGILVRGETDYVDDGGCNVVNVLSEEGGARGGEDATYVARAIEALCGAGWGSELCGETGGWCRPCADDTQCPVGWTCSASPLDPGVTWCSKPCTSSADCDPGHQCSAEGACEPEVEVQCYREDVWQYNSCGRRVGLVDECTEAEICEDGVCEPTASGNVCSTATVIEPVDATFAGDLSVRYTGLYRGSCAGRGVERVFSFTVSEEMSLVAEASGFDTVLYLRRDCDDETSEVVCNDDNDPPGENGARIDAVLEAGEYFLFLDSYGRDVGGYSLELWFTPTGTTDGDADADIPVDADVDEELDGGFDADADADESFDADADEDADREAENTDADVDVTDADLDGGAPDSSLPVVDADIEAVETNFSASGGCGGCSSLGRFERRGRLRWLTVLFELLGL